ncbi:hypothetical protein M5K25_003768 [Dendrobium thyrsiflorum]|uniref:AT-hook motif nuclear-localized protein n=1 Tax=Dendrobium thyrsiflorum TaxID=117978 RepID=A0ABD0VKD1_DENTH
MIGFMLNCVALFGPFDINNANDGCLSILREVALVFSLRVGGVVVKYLELMESHGKGNAGQGFTPHVITISAGEDLVNKLVSMMQKGKRAVCVLAATGSILNPSFRQPASSSTHVTYENGYAGHPDYCPSGMRSQDPAGEYCHQHWDVPHGRILVFETLSQPETLTTKRVVDGRKVSMVTANTIALPREPIMSGKYDAEAFSSGGKLNRRQRRKRNAELRAQQLSVLVHPSNLPAQETEANIPTQNKFANLKWVRRNSSTGELKQSFWERRLEAPTLQTRGPERLSARVHQVLKTVKARV